VRVDAQKVSTMRRFLSGAVAALILTITGCGGKTETPTGTEAKAKPAAEASKPAEVPKGPYITKFHLGYAIGSDGVVTVDGGVFAQGETAYTSFEVPNTPADSKIRIVWNLQPDNKTVAEEEMPVRAAYSTKADTKSWPLGEYLMQIYISSGTLNKQNMGLGTAGLKIVKDRPR
jgi:hypothetical protein